jgi:hypothetical protein
MDSNVFVNGVMMLSQWNRAKLQHTPNGIVLSVQVDLDSYAKDPTGYTWANLFFTSCGFGSNIRNNSEPDPAAWYDNAGNLVDRK